MNKRSDFVTDRKFLREKIIGLGERSLHKTHYPELQAKLAELERFRALLDQSNDCIFLLSIPSLVIVDVNESACHQLGYSRQALLSRTLAELVPQETVAAIQRLVTAEGGKEKGREILVTVFSRQGGKEFPVEMALRLVSFDGKHYGVVVARDITERRRAEEALRTQFSQITTIFDSLNAVVFVADMQTGQFLYMNRYGVALFGEDWGGRAAITCYREREKDFAHSAPLNNWSRMKNHCRR